MTNRKIIDYRVRIQVAEDSPDGVLLDFLKNERHPSFSHKEMVLWALRGYWMAIAFRQRLELGDALVSDAQIQRMALDTIHQLRQQISYIQSTRNMQEPSILADDENGADYRGESLENLIKRYDDVPVIRHSAVRAAIVDGSPVQRDEWYEGTDLFESSV
jgi:hypothetical protein